MESEAELLFEERQKIGLVDHESFLKDLEEYFEIRKYPKSLIKKNVSEYRDAEIIHEKKKIHIVY